MKPQLDLISETNEAEEDEKKVVDSMSFSKYFGKQSKFGSKHSETEDKHKSFPAKGSINLKLISGIEL